MSRPSEIPLEGELNCWTRGYDLPDILVAICGTKKTGLLRFVNSEAEKRLFLRGGSIVFATSSSEDDRLGEYLLRHGKVSLANLSKCIPLVRPGKRLGALLVERGLLEPRELVHAVIGQVRAIILSLFRWTEAWYGFDEQELPSKETITLDMPTARLIVDGVRLIDSWRRIVQGLGGLQGVYRTVPGNEDTVRALDLDKGSLEMLAMLHRSQSVEQACAASDLPDFEVCRMLWVFRCLGWVERLEPLSTGAEGTEPSAVVSSEPDEASPSGGQPEAVEVTSFEMIDEDATGASPSKRPEEAPGAQTTAATAEGGEKPVPVQPAASLADLGDSPVDGPDGGDFEPEIDLGDPFAAPEVDDAAPEEALVPRRGAEETGPEEFSEESPREDAPILPASSESEGPSASPPPEVPGPAPGAAKKRPNQPEPLETQDLDLEGLGMVLGEDEKH